MSRRFVETAEYTGATKIAHDRVIYAVQFGDGTPIKIGSTSGLAARLTKMSVDHYEEVSLLYLTRGGFREEHALHRKFASFRVRGEWYRPDPEVLEWCDSACERQLVADLTRSVSWVKLRKEAVREEHEGLVFRHGSPALPSARKIVP